MFFNIFLLVVSAIQFECGNIPSDHERARPTITFILGSDKPGENYFSSAKQYYLLSPTTGEAHFIDTCKTLLSVRNYLEENLPSGTGGWGQINVVVHGNPWSGMSAKIYEGGDRSTANSILNAVSDNRFAPLDNNVVNGKTSILFNACGLGSNNKLLAALQMAFGGFDNEVPKVLSTDKFVHFGKDDFGTLKLEEFHPYYVFYPTAFRPPLLHLQRDLKLRYPNIDLDWLALMEEEVQNSNWKIDRFNVPIQWEASLSEKEKGKPFESIQSKIDFVQGQKGLMNLLKEYDIPINKFRWDIKKSTHSDKVIINGKATVLCVLVKE